MVSVAVQEHFANPRNIGVLPGADVVGQDGVPGQGPFMQMYLRMAEGKIAAATFDTYGCPICRGCGSFVTCWVVGKTPAQASVMEAGDLMTILGGLPLGKEHCAALAVNSLQDALRQVENMAGAGAGERR